MTIGSDPEFILLKKKPVSAIGILPKKEHAIKLNQNLYFYDNVLAECNVTPSCSKEEFVCRSKICTEDLSEIIGEHKISPRCCAYYHAKELLHKDAVKFACEDELSAYTKCVVDQPKMTNLRAAGGHIHIGSEGLKDIKYALLYVKMLDLFLSVPFVMMENKNKRRKIYGKAGCFRTTSYGIEYRTPSNFWILCEKTIEIVYDICKFALDFTLSDGYKKFWDVDFTQHPKKAFNCYGYDINQLQKGINSYDKVICKKFMELTCRFSNISALRT